MEHRRVSPTPCNNLVSFPSHFVIFHLDQKVIDFDPPSTVKTKRPRVTFNEELNSVVPVIALPEKGHLKPVSPMESTDGSGDLRARRGKRC